MRTVIFDLDGTLADTSGDLLAAANHCFRAMGLGDVLTEDDAGVALRGGKQDADHGAFERVGQMSDATVAEYYPVLLEAYAEAIDTHTVMYPGAMEAVEALKTMGYGVGICTNKPEGLAETLMTRLGCAMNLPRLWGRTPCPCANRTPNRCLRRPVAQAVRLKPAS